MNQYTFNQDENVLPHPNAIRSQTGNNWFYGKDYDSIVFVTHPKKTKKISTVCSNKKQGHTIHRRRYEFTKIMEERIPELERFGRGFKWIETKAEALDDYEFHVAIENQFAPNVWTEKLADAFLGLTNSDNTNLMAAQLVKQRFKVPKIIIRVYDPERAKAFGEMGLNIICPTTIIAEKFKQFLL